MILKAFDFSSLLSRLKNITQFSKNFKIINEKKKYNRQRKREKYYQQGRTA